DEMFSNPKEWAKKLKEEVRTEVRQELNQKDATQKFWSDFYEKNPDLRNAERIVQSITAERWNDLKNRPVEEAAKILAQESRTAVEKIRGTTKTKETELP